MTKKRGRPKKERRPPLGQNGLGADDQRRLTTLVARVEKLRDERDEIDTAIRDVMKEADQYGFHTGTIRTLVAERRRSADKRQLLANLHDTYAHALGMLVDTPLGRSALVREHDAAADRIAEETTKTKRKRAERPLTKAEAVAEADRVFGTPAETAAAADPMPAVTALVDQTTAAVAAISDSELADDQAPAPTPATAPSKSAEELAGEAADGMAALRATMTPTPSSSEAAA